MSRSLPTYLLCTGLALGGAAHAGERGPVMLELYTSQGCSSCPPADALISELALRDDVLPLALHVDYWDYIGWVDQFASPAYTERQKSYAESVGSRAIFTPQIIVGGTDHVVGSKPDQVDRLIEKHAADPSPVTLSLERGDDMVTIDASLDEDTWEGNMMVQLVRFDPHERVVIEGGENAGQTIDYVNIVTEWRVLGQWAGEVPFRAELEVEGPLAVVVQKAGPGEVLAVAQID